MTTYPAGAITLNQQRRLIEGKEPLISYVAYDGSATFHLMGPLSPVAGVQSGVTVGRESIKGLIPSWRMLDQAGANQDGVTFNDAVYEPAEIDMVVEVQGLTPADTRQVIRDWVASWDAKQTGELHCSTLEQGTWWAQVRWLKAPGEPLARAQSNRQRFVWSCRIDDGFWVSTDSVSSFEFSYGDMTDTFNYGGTGYTNLGSNWPIRYTDGGTATSPSGGAGGGYIYADGSVARWKDDPNDLTFTDAREVVAGPYKKASLITGSNTAGTFLTTTDNQVVSIVLGTIPEASLPESAYNDIYGRMGKNTDGTWNGYGVRARMTWGYIELARYNNFVKTVMYSRPLIIPPVIGEKFTLVAGYESDPRLFKIMRDGIEILSHKEQSTGSALGSAYRGIGFGMKATAAVLTQATPANVRKISSGDNATVSQQGYLSLTNVGDVEAWPRFLLYGPGYFSIGNGPDSLENVEFGELLEGQVVLIETEPRRRSVVDLTPTTVTTTQDLTKFQKLIKALVTFASNNNVPPLLQQFESLFGILPPQGNLYQYLNGRFTKSVPAKSPRAAATTSKIFVRIDNGNSNSKVVAALTPRRRWPL
jgi:hypothetical protein